MEQIPMVDLKNQYQKIKPIIDQEMLSCLERTDFINGSAVKTFCNDLANYLKVQHVIPCANGTDALQLALMALNLLPGDEVICPSFSFFASAEAIALLNLKAVFVDVSYTDFNICVSEIESKITSKTKAMIVVHLYGQGCNMDAIMAMAEKHHLTVIEDNAQSLGAIYTNNQGESKFYGTIGHIGCTSFFPSKNLGCYGDGGALFTNDATLAQILNSLANHGQSERYYHKLIGCNSRLDTLQAIVLKTKLPLLNDYIKSRQSMAHIYNEALKDVPEIEIPFQNSFSSHVYHQYTLKIKNGKRDALHKFLTEHGISSAIYYPVALYNQEAFKPFLNSKISLPNTEQLCQQVLSLPIHSEPNMQHLQYIVDHIKKFFKVTNG